MANNFPGMNFGAFNPLDPGPWFRDQVKQSQGIAQQQQPLQAQAQQNASPWNRLDAFDAFAPGTPTNPRPAAPLVPAPSPTAPLAPKAATPAMPTAYSDAPAWDGKPDAMSTAYRSPTAGLPETGGGGGGISTPFFRAPTYAGYPTLHDQGQMLGAGLNNWLVNGYLNAPQAMTDQLNSAWDEQSYRNQQAQLYNNYLEAKYGTQNRLIDMLGSAMNGGGGGSGAGSGFRQFDIAGNPTGLYADSSGNTGTNVTAQALQPQQIASATSAMNTPAAQVAPTSVAGIQTGGDAGKAIVDAIQSNDAAQGGQNALAFDRSMTPANSDLAYSIQGERANQGVDLGRWLLGLGQLNNQATLFNQSIPLNLLSNYA